MTKNIIKPIRREPMKLEKTASGKQTLKISRAEWKAIGKAAGWMLDLEDRDVVEREERAERARQREELSVRLRDNAVKAIRNGLKRGIIQILADFLDMHYLESVARTFREQKELLTSYEADSGEDLSAEKARLDTLIRAADRLKQLEDAGVQVVFREPDESVNEAKLREALIPKR
jgi:hypothetical protein